ncbi:MAG TPA: phosphoadenylyl-sulfate reductase [Candidatus Elarobacter sp.]|nr:phosphoadenylyl-sulfate reductase [Candidatus Elarobacter sp.]
MTPIDSAEAIVADALRRFPGKAALACSFGAPSAMVLLDVALRVDRGVPVYYLDTGLLFGETYDLIERTARRYAIEPVAVKPALTLDAQTAAYGDALWAREPDRCCALRKVAPMREFLRGYEAWLSGIRRADSAARAATEPFERDADGLTKVNPLYDWSDDDVDRYVAEHDVPLNVLHFEGFPSLGCVPCTRAVAPGEDPRAGRWPGFAKTECGIHAPAQAVR